MSRLTCTRCGAQTRNTNGAYENGWAYPFCGGIMCPTCYDALVVIRAKYDALEQEAIRKWMAKGKK